MTFQMEWVESPSTEDAVFVYDLVAANAPHLSMFVYDKDSLIYEYLVEREMLRAHILLARVGGATFERVHLLMARKSPRGQRAGFALLAGHADLSHGASVTAIAVSEETRGQGCFKQMMEAIKARFAPSVALTCKPELVQAYEHLGFSVTGTYQTQLAMLLDPNAEPHSVAVADDDFVRKHPRVVGALRALKQRHGAAAIDTAIAGWQADFADAERRAEAIWRDRVRS